MDILRPFRKCFYCRRRGDLIQSVRHTAYCGTLNYYYHGECLKEVLAYPCKHKQYVDLALDIANGIELARSKQQRLIERAKCTYHKIYGQK